MNVKPTKVNWQYIDKVGMPPAELCFEDGDPNKLSRTFLIKGEYSITTAFVYQSGGAFATEEDYLDTPIAWAIIEGF